MSNINRLFRKAILKLNFKYRSKSKLCIYRGNCV